MSLGITMSGIKRALGQSPEQLEEKRIRAQEERKRKEELDKIYQEELHTARKSEVKIQARRDAHKPRNESSGGIKGFIMDSVAAEQAALMKHGGMGFGVGSPPASGKKQKHSNMYGGFTGVPSAADIIGLPPQRPSKKKHKRK